MAVDREPCHRCGLPPAPRHPCGPRSGRAQFTLAPVDTRRAVARRRAIRPPAANGVVSRPRSVSSHSGRPGPGWRASSIAHEVDRDHLRVARRGRVVAVVAPVFRAERVGGALSVRRYQALARRRCGERNAGMSEAPAGTYGWTMISDDTLDLRPFQPPARPDEAWDALVEAGLLRLPPSVPRSWIMMDGHTYVLEVRRGAEYRASRIEHTSPPETAAPPDGQGRTATGGEPTAVYCRPTDAVRRWARVSKHPPATRRGLLAHAPTARSVVSPRPTRGRRRRPARRQRGPGYAQPSCCRLIPSFQIFVMWRMRSPSNCMT
jgi:hypothetical protein